MKPASPSFNLFASMTPDDREAALVQELKKRAGCDTAKAITLVEMGASSPAAVFFCVWHGYADVLDKMVERKVPLVTPPDLGKGSALTSAIWCPYNNHVKKRLVARILSTNPPLTDKCDLGLTALDWTSGTGPKWATDMILDNARQRGIPEQDIRRPANSNINFMSVSLVPK